MSVSKNIDIIIPVYNAFDELTRCLESIWKWTELKNTRLILINDHSSDQRIYRYLNEIRDEHVVVIHNQENKGFPANVNIGMEQSDADVVLLNSDTVVTKGWLEKLAACTYSDPAVATATPLSNNATLCSVPDFCAENHIPDGYGLDAYAQLIEKVSLKKYPRIPVAHGFCMYIKREVIEQIGGFDAEAFGKGYGEENDFCYRAIQAGYCHVMCDDTFILHTGTSSFDSREKRKNIKEHERILDAKYPALMNDVRMYCRDNPNAVISENIRMWLWLNSREKRKTILYLVQSDFRQGSDDNIGGTQLHVKDLTSGLRSCYDIVVAARDRFYLNVTVYTKSGELPFQYYIGCRSRYEQFRSKEMSGLYRRILDNFGVDCVHIHHTAGLTLELYYESVKKGLPVFVTMHDYYYLCPNVKMLDPSLEPCVGVEHAGKCGVCLRQLGIADTVPYISIWRKENLAVLQLAETVFVPSYSAEKIIAEYFPEIQNKLAVIEHGLDLFNRNHRDIKKLEADGYGRKLSVGKGRAKHKDKKCFHAAFLGGINAAKGYLHAVELIKKSDKRIKWHLFGTFEEERFFIENRKNFVDAGQYRREDLPELLKKYSIDLICILSLWPETFCYTVSEAVLCGIPVLVTDIGALGDRVRSLGCGWTVPADADSADILKKIYEIRDNEADYQKMTCKMHKAKVRTQSEMCEAYKKQYDRVLGNRTSAEAAYDPAWLIEGAAVHKRISITGDTAGAMQTRLEELELQLENIKRSAAYRLIWKLAKVNIPFKRQVKLMLKELYRALKKRN